MEQMCMKKALTPKTEQTIVPDVKQKNPHLVDGKYSIRDLIDIESLRKALEKFSLATGFTTGFLEYPSQKILIATGWRDICTKFHRALPESAKHCKESNIYLSEKLKQLEELKTKPCENGLVDGATPIVIKGTYIAYLATGQVLFENPDIERFKKQAEIYGYDKDAYLEALSKVPVVSEDKFKNALSFLSDLAVTIAETGLKNLELKEKTVELKKEITERKRAADELRQSEEIHRTVTNSVSDSIVIVQDAKVMWANKVAIEIMGYSEDEFIGIDFTRVIHPEDLAVAIQRHQERISGIPLEEPSYLRFITKDGKILEGENRGAIITWEGKPASVQTIRDITEEKRKEEEKKKLEFQLQHVQKMEALGTLAGGIAHDFNNILYSIIGYTELAMGEISEVSLAQQNLKEVYKGAMRAKDMVQQILAFSRKADTQKKPIKIQSIVMEALKLLRTSIPSTIEIRQSINEECGPVFADSTQIHQMVMNIATNAYQAMRKSGGVLNLTLEEEEVSLVGSEFHRDLHPGKYLKLTVSDNGHGIDKVFMEKIFDPYFTTRGPGEGTGMGLAMVHGIVKDHGGNIMVSSELGKGTTFHIYLPIIKTRPVEPKTKTTETVLRGSERILFVDDEELITLMARQILEHFGYRVTSRTSSVEALEAFRAKPNEYDLVITDMTMPNMTGIELTSRLKEIRYDIPVIICTGFSEMIDEDKAEYMGISTYLMKPILKDELARAIRKVLDVEKRE